jgi:hypothetical protein
MNRKITRLKVHMFLNPMECIETQEFVLEAVWMLLTGKKNMRILWLDVH